VVNALIGSMPEDWREIALGDFCELIAGTSITEDSLGTVPVVKPRNLVSGRISGTTDYASLDEASRRARYRIGGGDLLAARTGSIGRVSLTSAEQEGWLFGTGIIRIRPDEHANALYLSLYLTHPAVKEWFATHSSGTAIPSINTKTLSSLPVALPSPTIQQAIGRTLDALNQKMAAHELICQATAELRDTLLPLLLSARVRP
jgi:restriction endonuclease S subunit